MLTAILCGHMFDPNDFENYPDDYAGYCPKCVRDMKEKEAESVDGDDEPDGVGLMEFDGESFDDEEDPNNDESALDEYEDGDDTDYTDPFADETEEDYDRLEDKVVKEAVEALDSIYK